MIETIWIALYLLWQAVAWVAPGIGAFLAIVLVANLVHDYGRARDERLREIIREKLWERDNH
jgi:hypothetical protein